jgi:hypothetical protein
MKITIAFATRMSCVSSRSFGNICDLELRTESSGNGSIKVLPRL